MIGPDSRVARAERIASRVVQGRAVVVLIDTRQLHTLNDVGTFVWEALEPGEASVADLVSSVVETFDVDRDVAARDVQRFLEEMWSIGALTVGEATS